jgi:hypothetical protein
MQDQRCSTFDSPRRVGAKRFDGLRRGRLPRGLIVCPPFLVSSCQQGVLDPQGPIARARRFLVFNAMNTTDPDNVDKTRGFALVSKKTER